MSALPKSDRLEIVKLEKVFQGWNRVMKATARHRKNDGTWSRLYEREVYSPNTAVAVLPYDPKLDCLVLIEQLRIPALLTGVPPLMIETVAGMVDRDASNEEIARHELEEEAGLTAGALTRIADFLPSPGSNSARVILYYTQVDASQAGGWYGLEEEDEEVRAFTVEPEEARALLTEGRIRNGVTIIALQWFLLNHKSLRSGVLPEGLPPS